MAALNSSHLMCGCPSSVIAIFTWALINDYASASHTYWVYTWGLWVAVKLGVKCSAYDLIGAAPDGHVLVQVHTEAVFNSPKHICWVCVVEQTCTVQILVANWGATVQLLIILTSGMFWPRGLCQLLKSRYQCQFITTVGLYNIMYCTSSALGGVVGCPEG